jgi:hypothetical protein
VNCSHCGKPIILTPSATERAKRYGGKASDYAGLFRAHADCLIKSRRAQTSELIKRLQEGED